MSIRVIVVDDQSLVRDGIVTVLSLADGIEVVAVGANGLEAVRLYREHRPDVTLIDLRMPELDGAGATARIRAENPEAKVLVLTTFDDDASIKSALDAGAAGYLTKDAGRDELVRAVRDAHSGRTPLDSRVAGRVIAGLPDASVNLAARFPDLTPREVDVLRHMADGRTNPQIASEMYVSVATVKSHVNQIFAKLGVTDRAAAIAKAR